MFYFNLSPSKNPFMQAVIPNLFRDLLSIINEMLKQVQHDHRVFRVAHFILIVAIFLFFPSYSSWSMTDEEQEKVQRTVTTNLRSFSDKYALFLMDFLSDFEDTVTKEHLDILAILSSASANLKSLEEEMQQILSKHPETPKKK